MPVYEFRCNACGASVSLFFRSLASEISGRCDRCGSDDLQRLVSRFAVLHAPMNPANLSKEKLLDGVDYTDPQSMASFFRRMQGDFQDGQDDTMDEIIGRLDHGEAVQDALGLNEPHGHEDDC